MKYNETLGYIPVFLKNVHQNREPRQEGTGRTASRAENTGISDESQIIPSPARHGNDGVGRIEEENGR